jgi:hypothetical protein
VIQVCWNDHHDSTGRQSDRESKVRDVQSPAPRVANVPLTAALRVTFSTIGSEGFEDGSVVI